MSETKPSSYGNPLAFNPEFIYTPEHLEFARLLGHLATFAMPQNGGALIHGISGFGGSGKSTIATSIPGAQVVPYDTFFTGDQEAITPDWDNYDAAKLITDVLEPLSRGLPGRYYEYDWVAKQWNTEDPPTVVDPTRPVVVEGVGLFRPDILPYFTGAKVWKNKSLELSVRGGIKRMGKEYAPLWLGPWALSDLGFFVKHEPDRQATFTFTDPLEP